MMTDRWKQRQEWQREAAWNALLSAIKDHGATIDEALDAIQIVFGLDAWHECQRKIEAILKGGGGAMI